jgi:tetratricopeptide (TPR) repeat protein
LPSAVLTDVLLNLGALDLVTAQARRGLDHVEREAALRLARARLQAAFTHAPGDAAVNRVLAMAALADSDAAGARAALARAETATAEDDGRALLSIGRMYRETDDVERAIAVWSRVDRGLGSWANDGPAVELEDWAADLREAQRWADSIALSRAAIELDSTSQRPYHALAVALSRQDGEEAAIQALEQIALAHPHVPWPLREAAALYDAMGRADQAAALRKRESAIRSSPEWLALQTAAHDHRR